MNVDYHIPVLLNDSVEGLITNTEGIYVDVTFGGGGHSSLILEKLSAKGRLFAFDQDIEAFDNQLDDKRFQLIHGNFRYIKNFLKYYGFEKVDGILADLGVSSHHFNEEDRGFSFRFDSPLDMRMNKQSKLNASFVINEYPEEKLSDIFYQYGEIHNARKLSKSIVNERKNKSIKTTFQLLKIIEPLAKKHQEHKYFAQVFQAIRIEVNQELKALKILLEKSKELLKPSGRISIITYHSLEDRLVKNFIKKGSFSGKEEKDFFGNIQRPFREVNRKIILPTDEELTKITGQRAIETYARVSNASFKIREGMPLGVKVTLRGEKMYQFLDKLITIALPRIRDFRGVKHKAFDGNGNYSLGISEYIIFPEIDLDKVKSMKGCDITIVTSASSNDDAYKLLEKFGMPFKNIKREEV